MSSDSFEISKYERNGYGLWQYGTAIPSAQRPNLMPASNIKGGSCQVQVGDIAYIAT
jgi:hypothetical protein